MKKITFLILLISQSVHAQFESAILKSTVSKDHFLLSNFHSALEQELFKVPEIHLFDWNVETGKATFVTPESKTRKPIGVLKFVEISLRTNLDDAVPVIVKDTSGKAKEVYFVAKHYLYLTTKMVDVKSSKILKIEKITVNEEVNTLRGGADFKIKVVDFLKEFGGEPAQIEKTNPTLYAKRIEGLRKKYQPALIARIKEEILSDVLPASRNLKSFNYEESQAPMKILYDPQSTEKRVNSIFIHNTAVVPLKEGSVIYLYEVFKKGKYQTLKYLNNYRVKEIKGDKAEATLMNVVGRKALAEIMKSGSELLAFTSAKSAQDYTFSLTGDVKPYVLGVDKACLLCDLDFERFVLSIPGVNLVERNSVLVFAFQNFARKEKFLEHNGEDLQNKTLGIRYLFFKQNGSVLATDMENGRVLGSETAPGWLFKKEGLAAKMLLTEVFEKPIQFIENGDVSKGKVKEMILYQDYGFDFGDDVVVKQIVKEKVGSKIVERKVEIGECTYNKYLSQQIGQFKVKDGEKAIFDAQQQGLTLLFEYKTKQ